jgi:hypothetical protein
MDEELEQAKPSGLSVVVEGDSEDGTSTNQDASSTTESSSGVRSTDEKRVMLSRVILMAVLLSTALLIASLVYVNASREERQDFETEVSESCAARSLGSGIHLLFTHSHTLYC